MHRRFAFQKLLNLPFHEALDVPDTDLRMRGPLVWTCKDVIANAQICEPWPSIPARGLRVLGTTEFTAAGILLVENSDTFDQVCRTPEIADRWLCVWGKGFVSTGLIDFLQDKPVPVAAWGDLDAHGIKIIHDVARRVRVPVHPVGMTVELWDTSVKRKQSEETLAAARTLAAQLTESGPTALRFALVRAWPPLDQVAVPPQHRVRG
ncbi:Wadjet anti-phage system protein JetD domain-containing protein [Lentzea sp. JNUCC 0626]|uniref:Wadjet anti-phage system protein JetD domain-containing protein n=1 Tax=Lentzea sp. JNUCC 0626 TaxID=3367513 RepID=UPI00374820F6